MAENIRQHCTKFSHLGTWDLCIHGCIVPPILISYFLNFLSSLLLSFSMNKFELKVPLLWDVVSYSLVDKCHYLRGTYLTALSGSLLR